MFMLCLSGVVYSMFCTIPHGCEVFLMNLHVYFSSQYLLLAFIPSSFIHLLPTNASYPPLEPPPPVRPTEPPLNPIIDPIHAPTPNYPIHFFSTVPHPAVKISI